jgi:hypothetical protein
MPAAYKMQMQMKYHLPPSPFHIEEELITGLVNAMFSGHLLGHNYQLSEDFFIRIGKIVDTANMLFGNNQQMNRCMGMNIFKYHQCSCLKQDVCIRLAMRDLTEDAVVYHFEVISPLRPWIICSFHAPRFRTKEQ